MRAASGIRFSIAHSVRAGAMLVVLGSMVCLGGTNPQADKDVEEALGAARSGNTVLALPLLERCARLHPLHAGNFEILYQLGLVYIEAGKPEEAEKVFATFTKNYGKLGDKVERNDDVRIAQARILAAKQQYDDAILSIRQFLKEKPYSKSRDAAEMVLARIYVDKSDVAGARAILEPLAKKYGPLQEQALFELAEVAAREGKYEETERIINVIIKNTRDANMKNAALFRLGGICRDTSNIVKALQAFRRIKDPGTDKEARKINANVLFEVAQTFEQLGHPLEARVGFEGVATRYSDTSLSTDAWLRAILNDADFGDIPRAGKTYQAFQQSCPKHPLLPYLRFDIGLQCVEHGRYSDAIEQFKTGLDEYPTGGWAEVTFAALGDAYLKAGKYADAEKSLGDFAKRYPTSTYLSQSLLGLGDAYLQQQRYGEAIEMYKKLASQFADSEVGKDAALRADQTRLSYGQIMIESNQLDEAIAQFKQVTSTNFMEDSSLCVADVQVRGQKYDDAIAQLTGHLEKFVGGVKTPDATFLLGNAYMGKETYAEAEKAFESLLGMQLSPSNELLPSAKFQIALCRYYSPSNQNDIASTTNALYDVIDNYASSPMAGDAWYLLANVHFGRQEYGIAAERYRDLAKKYPQHYYAHEAAYRAGETLVLNLQPRNAIPLFIDAFKQYPEAGYSLLALVRAGELSIDPAVNTNAARLEAWLAELDKLPAETATSKAILALARAGVLLRSGNGAALAACAGVADDTLPVDVQGYALALKAGAANAASNFTEAAKLSLQAAVACKTSGIGLDEALLQQARALYNQKSWKDAAAAYKRLLTPDTPMPSQRQNAMAFLEYAQCLNELGDADGAIAQCDGAIRMKAGFEFNARANLLKGDATLKRDDNAEGRKKAAQYYNQVVIRYPKDKQSAIPAFRKLIECYDKLTLTEDANKTRQRFAQYYPDAAKGN